MYGGSGRCQVRVQLRSALCALLPSPCLSAIRLADEMTSPASKGIMIRKLSHTRFVNAVDDTLFSSILIASYTSLTRSIKQLMIVAIMKVTLGQKFMPAILVMAVSGISASLRTVSSVSATPTLPADPITTASTPTTHYDLTTMATITQAATEPELEARRLKVTTAYVTKYTKYHGIWSVGKTYTTETKTIMPYGRFAGTCRIVDNFCTYKWDYDQVHSRVCHHEPCPYDSAPCVADWRHIIDTKKTDTWCNVDLHPELGLDLSNPDIIPPESYASIWAKQHQTKSFDMPVQAHVASFNEPILMLTTPFNKSSEAVSTTFNESTFTSSATSICAEKITSTASNESLEAASTASKETVIQSSTAFNESTKTPSVTFDESIEILRVTFNETIKIGSAGAARNSSVAASNIIRREPMSFTTYYNRSTRGW